MNYTLDICGERTISNPSEADIKQALESLNTDTSDAFLILSRDEMNYLQTSGDARVGFGLEYQENDMDHHYIATKEFKADQILKAFVSYLKGTADWKKAAKWELLRW